jgi:hypothetical protein
VSHLLDERVRHQTRGPGADDEDRPDDDVSLEAHLLDGVLRRGDGLERAAEVVVHLAQAVEVAVENEDFGVHADRHGGGGEAGDAGTEDHDTRGTDPGDPAHKNAPAAPGAHEVMRAHERRHPAGDLAHGCQKRE